MNVYLIFLASEYIWRRYNLRPTGESDKSDLFKDPAMLRRLSDLEKMEAQDKSHILHVLDGFIKSVQLKNLAAL